MLKYTEYTRVLVTVQEGGTWFPAAFGGTREDLEKALKDRNNWLSSERHGTPATYTVLPISIQGGMYTMAAIHSVKFPDDSIWDSYFRKFVE